MSQTSILFPCIALVFVTVCVWVRLYFERVGEMRARDIQPQAIATSRLAAETFQHTNAADNFRNLFEVPVLFYLLCLLLLVVNAVTPFYVAGAWLFVTLRAAHSLIQCTYNRVMHRFLVYLLSSTLLFLMWGVFAVQLLRA